MSLTAYQISIPVMFRGLAVLDDYVDHAQALAASQGLSDEARRSVLTGERE